MRVVKRNTRKFMKLLSHVPEVIAHCLPKFVFSWTKRRIILCWVQTCCSPLWCAFVSYVTMHQRTNFVQKEFLTSMMEFSEVGLLIGSGICSKKKSLSNFKVEHLWDSSFFWKLLLTALCCHKINWLGCSDWNVGLFLLTCTAVIEGLGMRLHMQWHLTSVASTLQFWPHF